MMRLSCACAVLMCAVLAANVRSAEPVPAEDFLPDNTVAAVIVPDLAATRAAASKTKLAGMFAQPEMQQFLQPVQAELQKQYNALRARNPMVPAAADIDSSLLSGELTAAVCVFPSNPKKEECVVISFRPKDAAAFQRLLPPQMQPVLFSGMPMPLDADGASMTWVNGRLVYCSTGADAQAVFARAAQPNAESLGKVPAYAAAKAKLSSPAGWLYLSPARFAKTIAGIASEKKLPPQAAQRIGDMFAALGLEKSPACFFSVGFSQGMPVLESGITLTGPASGIWGLCVPPPGATQKADAFKIAAPDAPFVGSGYFNLAGLLPLIQQTLLAVNPPVSMFFGMQLNHVNTDILKFDLQQDFLANIGPDFTVAQTPADTSTPLSWVPGMVYSFSVRNPAKVEECLNKFGPALEQFSGTAGIQYRLKKLTFNGKNLYYVSALLSPIPVVLCVAGDRLLAGTSVNAVRRTLEQLEKPETILSNKSFQEAVARVTGKPFDANALPYAVTYGRDDGSGGGSLLLTGAYYLAAGAVTAALSELPGGVPGEAAPGAAAGIPANEAAAQAACKAFAEAEEIYRRTDYDGDGVLEYAQSLKGNSSLLEKTAGAGDLALIDKTFAEAEGNPAQNPKPKAGYCFKVLKAQGAAAEGGKRSYVVNGNMTLGYALLAYPAVYGKTGKNSFMINNFGTIRCRDLGPNTAVLAAQIEEFLPDSEWREAEETDMMVRHENRGNPVEAFLGRPAGKTVMALASAVDLGLWPDETFFRKYRIPTAGFCGADANGVFGRTELPWPSPGGGSSQVSMMAATGIVAVIAAIAIPSLLRSRMAANQTAAAANCKAFAEAEEIYRRTDYDGDGLLEYAQSLKGANSLLEKTAGTGDLALIDRTFANAEGNPSQRPAPKAGYCFKVLKAQGEHATGGKRSYVVNGNMVLGYALVAYPAAYDGTGRDTFIISSNGMIFQKDMGPETPKIVEAMTEFDPDNTWAAAE